MKKRTLITTGALALCTLLSGCSHRTVTLQGSTPSDARVQLWQIDAVPSAPVRIGNATLTPAQLQQGVLVDNPDAALKVLAGTHKATLLDDNMTGWGRTVTEQRSGPDNLLWEDLYISRQSSPQDTLTYSFHAGTTEAPEETVGFWRSLRPEHAIAYTPGKTLMVAGRTSPDNASAVVAFITPN
ncbi:hypothetical protein [Klebsiella michiganensis]|uniref:hypothetical protein n=1 Tax=Klebsiella michiganensis TaxID=1134687 RepID=UPI003F4FDA3C